MCIAVYKPAGAQFPAKKTLKTCFYNNPDGAGYMYTDGDAVHIKKGFFSFSSFWKSLQKTRESVGDSAPYVLHFRISTQGGIRADCCHPFPLSEDMNDLRQLSTAARVGIVHNGIIPLTSTYSRAVNYSDTMQFITDYLSLIITNGKTPTNEKTLALIGRLCESRLAILDARGVCRLIGDGWRDNGGVWYSNGSYKPATIPATATKKATTAHGLTFFDPLTDCPYGDDFEMCDQCEHWRECVEFYSMN